MTGAASPFRVLLVEEEPTQTEIYSDLIKEIVPCQIDIIGKSEGVLDLLGQNATHYQLIVLNIPRGVNATEWLERIKRLSPETGVILLSEAATVEQAVSVIRMGAEDYFQKPVNLELFQLSVQRSLDKKTVFDQNSGASTYLNLLHSCQQISAALEQSKVFAILQSFFLRELHSSHSAYYKVTQGVVVRVEDPNPEQPKDRAMEEILDISLAASNPVSQMTEMYRFIERGQLTPGLFIFKFRCVADTDFFYVCLSPERPAPMEEFESRLRLLKAQIEVTGRNIEQYQGVQSLVYVDDATGLYNTRYLSTILDHEIHLAEGSDRSFAILFIDIDFFKRVNDRYGHLVGTRILNDLGVQLKKFVRERDTVFRYGGDEFVAVLSPSDLPTAQSVAERIRKSIEEQRFLADEGLDIQFTVSIGVALFPKHARSKRAIIEAADHAMYSAKKSSRNKVFLAGEEGSPLGEDHEVKPLRTEIRTEHGRKKSKSKSGKQR